MSWLSPVSWAKWTWTAVRGAEGDDEEGQEASEQGERRGERRDDDEEEEEEEEERSQGCRQVLCWSPDNDNTVFPEGGYLDVCAPL